MLYKIVEDGAKFKIKELDADGNSKGILEEVFDTHEAATAHIKSLEGDGSATPGASAPTGEGTITPPAGGEASAGPVLKKYKVIDYTDVEEVKSITLADGTKHVEGSEISLDPEGEEAKELLDTGYIEEVAAAE